jgi:hypothetical protein
VPSDNPFVVESGCEARNLGYGLRMEVRLIEVGRHLRRRQWLGSWEIVHEIVRGGNCGWPIGSAALRGK